MPEFRKLNRLSQNRYQMLEIVGRRPNFAIVVEVSKKSLIHTGFQKSQNEAEDRPHVLIARQGHRGPRISIRVFRGLVASGDAFNPLDLCVRAAVVLSMD